MLTAKMQDVGDSRRYVMMAIRGVGHCHVNTTGLCKVGREDGAEKPHVHEVATRIGYDAAADWVNEMKSNGWHVVTMDRVY